MPQILEIIKAIFYGIVEGITEWLPISSTGHLILFSEFMGEGKDSFFTQGIFEYVIQLGAILAIATLYFRKLNPFALSKTPEEKKATWSMWFKVIVACLPAAVIGLLFNDYMDKIDNAWVVSSMLILYGIGFILVERRKTTAKVTSIDNLTYKTAMLIGAFQVLSIVPGTSRSGATILGAIILGLSREVAAEFSFFLAVPVMFGVSGLKIVTNDYAMSITEWVILAIAMVVAYVVSLIAVKFLTGYVKRHDFKVFGWYRIVLGVIVLGYFSADLLLK